MQARKIRFAIAVLFVAIAWGQAPTAQSVTQVFHFTDTQAPANIQQITNAVRTIGEITQAFPDADSKTLTVTGTHTQVAMAAWMFNTLDQPAPATPATQEYRPTGSVNDVVRVLYRTHPGTPASFQEIVNAMRTIPQMTKVLPYSAQNAVVMRGADSQVSMAEWLFHQLDLSAGMQPVQDPATHRYVLPRDAIGSEHVNNNTVQVLFLVHPWTPESLQLIVNTVRTIPELTSVFPSLATGAVALRGPAGTIAVAAWLFNQLDQAPRISILSPQVFQWPGRADDVIQVFYLTPATTTESLQNIVTTVRPKVSRAMPETILKAVTLRGTAAQIAAADVLIKQMNQP